MKFEPFISVNIYEYKYKTPPPYDKLAPCVVLKTLSPPFVEIVGDLNYPRAAVTAIREWLSHRIADPGKWMAENIPDIVDRAAWLAFRGMTEELPF
jgi:hypothetical protein